MNAATEKISRAIREGGVGLLLERAANKVRWSLRRRSYLGATSHDSAKGAPSVRMRRSPERGVSPKDVENAERVLAALRRAQRDERGAPVRDLWSRILESEHADFHTVAGDAERVATYLNNVNQRGLGFGIADCPSSEYEALSGDPRLANEFGAVIKDAMVSLAEAVGAVPYNARENLYLDEDDVLDRIERQIGRLEPSDAEGLSLKAEIGGRLWGARDFWSAYVATRVVGKGRVAEIGGGMGKVAWYAHQLGVTDYAIYDLPIINVVQAWTLMKKGVEVSLYGENRSGVRVLPHWTFAESSSDLTLNVDSFPEMGEPTVAAYLKAIKRNSSALLSINRENGGAVASHTHNIVREVVERVGGFRLTSRSPFWISREYVEELYIPHTPRVNSKMR